jgi:uncharacterized protein
MSELKTPGVYVEEVTKFPPSVAQVETAIPAFIGYTENVPSKPVQRITSLLEYETLFGKANKEAISLKNTEDNGLTLVAPKVKFLMYYSLQMYFANGGGPCYIVSVGNYTTTGTVELSNLKAGLDLLAIEDEPTLIVFPDATSITDQEQFYALYQDALTQAEALKDRFVILDTYKGESITTTGPDNLNTINYFRNKIKSTSYGAAYFPHLKTVLNYTFDEGAVITHTGLQPEDLTPQNGSFFQEEINALNILKSNATTELSLPSPRPKKLGDLLAKAIAIVEKINETADVKVDLSDAKEVLEAVKDGTITDFNADQTSGPSGSFTSEFQQLIDSLTDTEDLVGEASGKTLEEVKLANSELYHQIKKEIASLKVVLPPSSAMAGVYAKVDSTNGVWKAPANVGVNYVETTTEKISNVEQDGLNVDAVAGKSINAIRTFTGKGTLVWGARTLDGNSNEWRYVPVRRFFNMVEESVQKATERFVFDSNTASTWVRVQAMIENFLTQQWKDGALAGSTPKEAFYVSVGLNKTMSAQDILEGRMNIEIGMAAVRPAEFIVLRFSHKLQES